MVFKSSFPPKRHNTHIFLSHGIYFFSPPFSFGSSMTINNMLLPISPIRLEVPWGQSLSLCLIQVFVCLLFLCPTAQGTEKVLNKCLLHKWMEAGTFYVIQRLITRSVCPQGLNWELGKNGHLLGMKESYKVYITKSYIVYKNVPFFSWRWLKFHQKLTLDTTMTCFPLSEFQIVYVPCIHSFCLGEQKACAGVRLHGVLRRIYLPEIAHAKQVAS